MRVIARPYKNAPSIDHSRLICILLDYIRDGVLDIEITALADKLAERSCDVMRTIHGREDAISSAIKHDLYFVSSNIKTKLNEDVVKWSKTDRAPSRIVLVPRGGIVDYLAANPSHSFKIAMARHKWMGTYIRNATRGGFGKLMRTVSHDQNIEIARRARLERD
jgi:hypothetical protein